MKKVFFFLLAVLSIAGAAEDPQPEKKLVLRPGLAAELVPADVDFFIEVPDVARTLERWKRNGLYLIWQEAEVQDFFGKWRDFATENPYAIAILGELEQVKKAEPASFFFAVSKDVRTFPKAVGGFAYRGPKADAEKIVGKLRDLLLGAWTDAKTEKSTHGEMEIETITRTPGQEDAPAQILQLAYHDNWVFFATDRVPAKNAEGLQKTALTALLDRFQQKAGAVAGLGKDAMFQETLKHGSADPDVTMWVRGSVFAPVAAQISSMFQASEQPAAEPPKDPNPLQALLYSWKLDGAVMRERLYFHYAELPKVDLAEHRSLALTNPNTYAYFELNYDNLVARSKWLRDLSAKAQADLDKALGKDPDGGPRGPLPPLGFMNPNAILAKLALNAEDALAAFGPELAFASTWPGGIFSRLTPDFVAAIEVRNAATARKIADLIAEGFGAGGGKPAIVTTEGGVTRWVAAEPLAPVGPYKLALALTEKHLIFGITPAAVDTAIKQFATNGPNVATKPNSTFAAAAKSVNPAVGGLFYVDTKAAFERLYSLLKPTIAFQIVGTPELAKYFDSGKLPMDTTFSKHLAPVAMSYGPAGQGWMIEATGTVSVIGLGGVLASTLVSVRAETRFEAIQQAQAIQDARGIKCANDIQYLGDLLTTYKKEAEVFPSNEQGLDALVNRPGGEPKPREWKKRIDNVPFDAWGNAYEYRQPGKHNKESYDLFSKGPDRVAGTADDIGNWER